jgi:hypothetical protein
MAIVEYSIGQEILPEGIKVLNGTPKKNQFTRFIFRIL